MAVSTEKVGPLTPEGGDPMVIWVAVKVLVVIVLAVKVLMVALSMTTFEATKRRVPPAAVEYKPVAFVREDVTSVSVTRAAAVMKVPPVLFMVALDAKKVAPLAVSWLVTVMLSTATFAVRKFAA